MEFFLILFVLVLAFTLAALTLLQTRRFYFIRHGETLLNAQHIKQGEGGELSPLGRAQAEKVAAYLKQFSIGRIISSPYPRAKETALILQNVLRVPVTYCSLLVERRNPSEVIGKPTDDPTVVRIVDQIDLAYHDDDYRFSDEENFMDVKKRARLALHALARQWARETCVVTHHGFLKVLVAYLLYREDLQAADFVKLSFFNYSDNGGITVCEFRPWKAFSRTRGWSVVSYNERLG